MNKSRVELWKKKGLTITDRLDNKPAIDRDIDDVVLNRKLERGDVSQRLRLKYYPSINVGFDNMYAGSFEGTLDELEQKLYNVGFRNNPTAYVEITDEYGPDDGSYAKQRITEGQDFPYLGLGRPLGSVVWWNRIKEQIHITVYVEEDSDWIHILSHMEASAWLQPARHVTVSEGDANIGIREFREAWRDKYGKDIATPLA